MPIDVAIAGAASIIDTSDVLKLTPAEVDAHIFGLASISLRQIQMLVENHPSILFAKHSVTGNTLLHEAVEKGFKEKVAILLYLGAQSNITNAATKTPMHLAVEKGHEGDDIAIMLISKDENKSYQIADAARQTVFDIVKRDKNIRLDAFMRFKYSCITDPIAPEMARELKAEYERLEYVGIGFVRQLKNSLASATLCTEESHYYDLVSRFYESIIQNSLLMEFAAELLELISTASVGDREKSRSGFQVVIYPPDSEKITLADFYNSEYPTGGRIYLNGPASHNLDDIKSDLLGSFVHYTSWLLYKNNAKPYYADDALSQKEYAALLKEFLACKDVALIERITNSSARGMVEANAAENDERNLIALVPQIISEEGRGGIDRLERACPSLLRFYRKFLNDCKRMAASTRIQCGVVDDELIYTIPKLKMECNKALTARSATGTIAAPTSVARASECAAGAGSAVSSFFNAETTPSSAVPARMTLAEALAYGSKFSDEISSFQKKMLRNRSRAVNTIKELEEKMGTESKYT